MQIKEYILCAAIWYKDLPLIKNDIPSGLLRPINCEMGIVFCGHRHCHCLYQMVAITGKRQCEVGEEVQGFLTSSNRFVDRKEAAKIAIACGQVEKCEYFGGTELDSSELYKTSPFN